jgi:hypothetical protein
MRQHTANATIRNIDISLVAWYQVSVDVRDRLSCCATKVKPDIDPICICICHQSDLYIDDEIKKIVG